MALGGLGDDGLDVGLGLADSALGLCVHRLDGELGVASGIRDESADLLASGSSLSDPCLGGLQGIELCIGVLETSEELVDHSSGLVEGLGDAGLVGQSGDLSDASDVGDRDRRAGAVPHRGDHGCPLGLADGELDEHLARVNPVVLEVTLAGGLVNLQHDVLAVLEVGLEEHGAGRRAVLVDGDHAEGGVRLVAVGLGGGLLVVTGHGGPPS